MWIALNFPLHWSFPGYPPKLAFNSARADISRLRPAWRKSISSAAIRQCRQISELKLVIFKTLRRAWHCKVETKTRLQRPGVPRFFGNNRCSGVTSTNSRKFSQIIAHWERAEKSRFRVVFIISLILFFKTLKFVTRTRQRRPWEK